MTTKVRNKSRAPDVVTVDKWVPNWSKRCDICNARGTVTGQQGHRTVYRGDMCGVCTWGEAAMTDPDNWNK